MFVVSRGYLRCTGCAGDATGLLERVGIGLGLELGLGWGGDGVGMGVERMLHASHLIGKSKAEADPLDPIPWLRSYGSDPVEPILWTKAPLIAA